MTLRNLLVSAVVGAASAAIPSVAAAQPSVTCGAGESAGVDAGQQAAVVQLVCVEVARYAEGRADAAGDYRVTVRRLDRTVLLTLDVTRPSGRDGRTLTLASLDEAPQAAPRLAGSLIRGEALSTTAKIDNVVGEESRAYKKRPSESFWTVGLAGVSQSEKVSPQGALMFGYRVETKHFGATLDTRLSLGGNGRDADETNLYALSLGGRYLFSDGEISPYVGGGVGYANVSFSRQETVSSPYTGSYLGRREWSVTGFMPFVEAGVTFARLSKFRIDAFVRVDAPLAKARDTNQSIGTSDTKYLLPITVGAAMAF